MIVVMQCAKTKRAEAGYMRTIDGQPVVFVAHPSGAPPKPNIVYARPDEAIDTNSATDAQRTWRDEVEDYNLSHNADPSYNPLNLLPANQFYNKPAYRILTDHLDPENFYILSAGWGLIKSSFLIPYYDIAFNSKSSERYQRRSPKDVYQDFAMLPNEISGPVIFLGGLKYVPLFCELTNEIKARRIVFHNSKQPPSAPKCEIYKFSTPQKTNWHYQCAKDLVQEDSTVKQIIYGDH